MNTLSIRSLGGSSFAPPESGPEGRGTDFDGLLRSEIGASPSREARGEPRNPDGSREDAARRDGARREEDQFEAGASQQGRAGRSSPTRTSDRREIDESEAADIATARFNATEDEAARAERGADGAVVLFGAGERIGDSAAPGDATADSAVGPVEVAIAAAGAAPAGVAAGRTAGSADPASTAGRSGGSSEAAAAIAGTAAGEAAARARSEAGSSGAAVSAGSGDGSVRAALEADSVRGAGAERGAASDDVRSAASTSQAVGAVAAGAAQESTPDASARAAGRAIAGEGGESDAARTGPGPEALEPRIAGRAASLAGGEAGRVAASGSPQPEGAGPAVDSGATRSEAAVERQQGSERRGARGREGGEEPPRDDRPINLQLTDERAYNGLVARADFDPAIGVGSIVPATAPVGDANGAATHVQMLPSANIGATAQPGAEASPPSASPPAPAADALAAQTEWLATRGGGSARLVLHPPELGEIAIRVSVRDGSVDVVMIAHEAAAKAIAEEQSDRLAQAFSSRDLRMGSFEVRQAESRAATEGSPDARLGNPDARDGGQSRRDSNAAADGRVDRVAGTSPGPLGRPAGLPSQAFSTPAERSVDLRI